MKNILEVFFTNKLSVIDETKYIFNLYEYTMKLYDILI